MLKIAIGTTNPAKVQAIQKAFEEQYKEVQFQYLKTHSHVSEQPMTDQETIEGALNRAKNVLKATDSDAGIGLEGGVSESLYGMFVCNWGALVDRQGNEIIGGGARISLPNEISRELKAGKELGPLMDKYTQRTGIRKKEGAVGIFTNGLVTRETMFLHVVQLLVGQWQYRTK
ncbi:inosine/xanthosine triphosphatase [Bacillus sp. es.034]|nr:inosine/xanthosine triphosphatase [Bacillus sp. es.034]